MIKKKNRQQSHCKRFMKYKFVKHFWNILESLQLYVTIKFVLDVLLIILHELVGSQMVSSDVCTVSAFPDMCCLKAHFQYGKTCEQKPFLEGAFSGLLFSPSNNGHQPWALYHPFFEHPQKRASRCMTLLDLLQLFPAHIQGFRMLLLFLIGQTFFFPFGSRV